MALNCIVLQTTLRNSPIRVRYGVSFASNFCEYFGEKLLCYKGFCVDNNGKDNTGLKKNRAPSSS